MGAWFHRGLLVKRPASALVLISASGGLLFFCGGLAFLNSTDVPASNDGQENKTVQANKTTLTHAERVVLTAERMHLAQYRAAPNDSLETTMRNAVFGDHGLRS